MFNLKMMFLQKRFNENSDTRFLFKGFFRDLFP